MTDNRGSGAPDPLLLSVQYLRGVGPARAKLLGKLGLGTVIDVLEYFPRRYEDRTNLKPISAAQDGSVETVRGVVTGIQEHKPRPGLTLTKVGVTDGTAVIWAVWFNRGYLARQFAPGVPVILTGRVERAYGRIQIQNPEYEVLDHGSEALHTGRIVPIYSLTEGLSARAMRSLMKSVVDRYAQTVTEILPADILSRYGLVSRAEAFRAIHFPPTMEEASRARRRLAFDELFLLQLGLAVMKSVAKREENGVAHAPDGQLTRSFLESLPFKLTAAQERAYDEVRGDMESDRPMNRLVQGDVGAGKTMVAALALLKAVGSGRQGAMMAPTEILADQHYLNLGRSLSRLGVRVALVTGSQKKSERERTLKAVADGEVQVVIGTHALIQEDVRFSDLSLVVTDEQHRFGVRQRADLKNKGCSPDVLVMTATPIPRTLALTLYGDLDVSVIDRLPPGRRPIMTKWLTPAQRGQAFRTILDQAARGHQAYVVCPLVSESEKIQAQAATEMAARLQEQELSNLKIGLIHGRMRSQDKDAVIGSFRAGAIDVLVSTTVIEVGVDVPNATVMVIEGADRYGLAQLHQLRGRTGRGAEQSYCFLIGEPKSDEGRQRMRVMERTTNGFVIAEEDLKLRGPGEFFGQRQHGLPDLKVANVLTDTDILQAARREAFNLVAGDGRLSQPEHEAVRRAVRQRFKGGLEMILVG